ncbi:hypothetical protein ATW55_09625 [Ferroacidibacillus organovorans]|uniref:M23ase beta-sheet core domain-containing protein n=1 Tax=Ferroacidibacillus organovorans TaxID=1765683 RepID=A0A117SXZ6_9BACL|nr:hypothetical protein ATW55_09625 [Ferroacidibacillus organovorans]
MPQCVTCVQYLTVFNPHLASTLEDSAEESVSIHRITFTATSTRMSSKSGVVIMLRVTNRRIRQPSPLVRAAFPGLTSLLVAFPLLCGNLSAYAATDVPHESRRQSLPVHAASDQATQAIPDWYRRASIRNGIPWYLLAGLDVYGATTTKVPPGVVRPKGKPITITGYRFPTTFWQGLFNPVQNDDNPKRIALFEGRGRDGDNDQKALQDDPYDRVEAIAAWLRSGGPTEQDQMNVLWNTLNNPAGVERILALSNVYRKFQTTQLTARCFPLHKRYNYSFRDTWGEGRSFGGRRIHEGTDLFADYGTPVLSTCYGYVELIGWNRLGGWRIGLRSADNQYFYFAHLSAYAKQIKQGAIVRPGQVIGYVGSSGYGKPGTSGKFPPHLHFGVYRDTGTREWAFDPYPLLKQWERKSQVVIYPESKKIKTKH